MDKNEFHEKYHEAALPWSYGSIQNVGRYLHNQLGRKVSVAKLLSESDVYSKFHPLRRPRSIDGFNPIFVRRKRELFQADCVYFKNEHLVRSNNGFAYLLVIIDCATKFSWNFPLKSLKCREVVEKFKLLFEKVKPPVHLQTDEGSEFACRELKSLFKTLNINYYSTASQYKAAYAERFNLSLQTLLYKLMSFYRTYNWVSLLKLATKIYHTRRHRAIGMSPETAELDSSAQDLAKAHNARFAKIKRKKPKFSVGDSVRIARIKGKFARGYHQNFSNEIFIIVAVYHHMPKPLYKIKTKKGGEVIKGNFSGHELVLYNPPPIKKLWTGNNNNV